MTKGRAVLRERQVELARLSEATGVSKGGGHRASQIRKSAEGRRRGASNSMYESMSEQQLDEFASTKHKGTPQHVAKSSRS